MDGNVRRKTEAEAVQATEAGLFICPIAGEKYKPTQICPRESAAVIKHGTRFRGFPAAGRKTTQTSPEKCRASPYLRQTEEVKCARCIFICPLFREACQETNQHPYCSPQIRLDLAGSDPGRRCHSSSSEIFTPNRHKSENGFTPLHRGPEARALASAVWVVCMFEGRGHKSSVTGEKQRGRCCDLSGGCL